MQFGVASEYQYKATVLLHFLHHHGRNEMSAELRYCTCFIATRARYMYQVQVEQKDLIEPEVTVSRCASD